MPGLRKDKDEESKYFNFIFEYSCGLNSHQLNFDQIKVYKDQSNAI